MYKILLGLLLLSVVFAADAQAYTFTLSLQKGSSNNEVTELQKALKTDSSIYPEGLVTGYFGSLTERAVQRFQTKYGIVSSGTPIATGYGFIGPRTRARLNEVFNVLNGTTSLPSRPVDSEPSLNVKSPSSSPPSALPDTRAYAFTSPTNSDVWKIGEPHIITFNKPLAVGGTPCGDYIELISESGILPGRIPIKVQSGVSSIVWDGKTIDDNVCKFPWAQGGPKAVEPGRYWMRLVWSETASRTKLEAIKTGIFTLVSNDASSPAIAITKPNGGEIITANQDFSLTWNSENLASFQFLFPFLIREEDIGSGIKGSRFVAVQNGQGRNDYMKVLSSTPSGKYRFRLELIGAEANKEVSDVSDAPFTIVSGIPRAVGSLEMIFLKWRAITPPSLQGIELTRVRLRAGAGEDVKISEIAFGIGDGGGKMVRGDIKNLRLVLSDGRVVGSVNEASGPYFASPNISMSTDLVVAAGASVEARLLGDIASTALFNSVETALIQADNIKASGVISGGPVFVGTSTGVLPITQDLNPGIG